MEILQSPHELTGSQKFKMTAENCKPLISQLVDQIATRFQRYYHIILVDENDGYIAESARIDRKSEIQDGGEII